MSLDGEKQFLCPRLIDYLTIVGARHSNNFSKQNTSPHIQGTTNEMREFMRAGNGGSGGWPHRVKPLAQ
ncbi:hypothetical protein NQ318_010382 [Aromia moschata]|uniref:Uncharacterized protein n=1 Tax=Aromia moschata TaxID=1265417 RepID=A0AAV8XVV3_9CUCU|nr:hypothetical protein NQ318_010382 [Aromia moschata]